MMLTAKINGERVHIWNASHGNDYKCIHCGGSVVPHMGRVVVHHFKHKPGAKCSAGSGESRAHVEAKELLVTALMDRGLSADVEVEVKCLSRFGDRHADVLVQPPPPAEGNLAIEVQRSNIQPKEFEKRTKAYRDGNVHVMWIPFAEKKAFEWDRKYELTGGRRRVIVERYNARPWEKDLHELLGEVWYYAPDGKTFWLGDIEPYMRDIPYSEYYSSEGDHISHGGYEVESKRWVTLDLQGPYLASELLLRPIKKKGLLLATFAFAKKEG